MKKYKIVFLGTPQFSVPVLEGLIEHHDVILVVTQPDKPIGREQKVTATPVKTVALNHNIEVYQPVNLRKQSEKIVNLKADYIITCAYGQIVPNDILNKFPHHCINIHASLLPKYRGGAPIHRAIMHGEYETGITIMEMAERLDAGDIITQKKIPITDEDNAGTMHNKLSLLAKEFIIDTLPHLSRTHRTKQDEASATFAFNIDRQAEHIDFSKPKKTVYNRIRGLNPWPIAYALLGNKEIKIHECYMKNDNHYHHIPGEIVALYDNGIGVKVADGELVITKIKPEGKKIMSVKDYLNGIEDKKSLIGKVFM